MMSRPRPGIGIDPLTPDAWGLPAKFVAWRKGQFESVVKSIDSPQRFIAKAKPTGSGKSLEYITEHLLGGGRTLICTRTKALQDQLLSDFGEIGLVDIRGKDNYPCSKYGDQDTGALAGIYDRGDFYTCEEGAASKCPKARSKECPHWAAVDRVKRADLVVTNYSCHMMTSMHSEGWGTFDRLVLDEAHEAPEAVADALGFEITTSEVQTLLHANLLGDAAPWLDWVAWASTLKSKAEELEMRLKDQVTQSASPSRSLVKDRLRVKKLIDKFKAIISEPDKDGLIVEASKRGMKFDVMWPYDRAEQVLFLGIARVIMVSATLRPKTLQMLDLKPTDYLFEECRSSFDPKRAPVVWTKTARLDKNAGDYEMAMVIAKLSQIANARSDRKGIIHTVSYSRQSAVLDNAGVLARRMIARGPGEVAKAVELFKSKAPASGAILVSPAVTTGYDFPHDECRYQVILKVPFPDSRSKVMKARQKRDKSYGPYLAMQGLVQACGRGMRGETDWCETFILDDNAGEWFLSKWKHLAPAWFWQFYRAVPSLPAPLNLPSAAPASASAPCGPNVCWSCGGPALLANGQPCDCDDVPF